MKRAPKQSCWTLLIALWVSVILGHIGCGGGTAGTGLDQDSSFEGRVTSTTGAPIPDLRVTIIETQASTTTDADGRFVLESPTSEVDEEIQLAFVGASINTQVTLAQLDERETRSTVDIVLDLERNTARISKFDVKAEIVGACDPYFENRAVIRQANAAPQGVTCVVKVKVLADGQPKGGIPVALQYKSCASFDDWDTIIIGTTSPDVHHGVVQLPFRFFDSDAFCRYRVVAPFNLSQYQPVVFPIETFTFQSAR